MPFSENPLIVVIGLGYVGLQLAVQFAKTYRVIGFDKSNIRIEQLIKGHDKTGEVPDSVLSAVGKNISYTADTAAIADSDIYIVAVPTPITRNKIPDLYPLESASRTIGGIWEKVLWWYMNRRSIRDVPKEYVFLFWKKKVAYVSIETSL